MPNLLELKQDRQRVLTAADEMLQTAERAKRTLTESENAEFNTLIARSNHLANQIGKIESESTVKRLLDDRGRFIPLARPAGPHQRNGVIQHLSPEYMEAFYAYVASNGQKKDSVALSEGFDEFGGFALPSSTRMQAALSEGTNSAGGYALNVTTDSAIVPLAPNEMAVRQLATVIPTSNDIKLPLKESFGSSTAKSEGSAFTENDPTIGQATLSAFMAGNMEKISWELAQDVPAFQAFCVEDGIIAQQMYEENKYINGSGSGEPQGLIGNVGAGTTQALSLSGILDLIGTLKGVYHRNASFLMQRATSIAIRKLQVGANLYEPVWTRVNGQPYLYDYPVYFSDSMPANSSTNTPILFGDFRAALVIGDRGGSGINVKVLDQPFAVNGQIAILFYRRTDSRIRRSEAVQGYTL